MQEIELYTMSGDPVATVGVPPFDPPVEIIQWGSRLFTLRPDGRYLEALAFAAYHVHALPPASATDAVTG